MITNPDKYILDNYGKSTSRTIAAVLGPEWSDVRVRVRAQRLGIATKVKRSPAKDWERNRDTVREMWPKYRLIDIAEAVGKSEDTVRNWAKSMQLPGKVEIVPHGARATPARETAKQGKPRDAATIIAAQRSRWQLEQHLSEADRSRTVRCVCGALGAPIHCQRHANLVQRVLS